MQLSALQNKMPFLGSISWRFALGGKILLVFHILYRNSVWDTPIIWQVNIEHWKHTCSEGIKKVDGFPRLGNHSPYIQV